MKTILSFLVLFGAVLYASPLSENDKAELKELRKEIRKEVRANVTKLIGELNAALNEQIAIVDDKSKTVDEKIKALLELRKGKPKVYNVLWSMFEKYIPPKIFYKRYENASETEKAEIDEAKKEVRAKITKLIGELSAVLDKRSAILDDESKNREDKIKALLELRKENPDASDILYVTFTQFLPKNNFFGKSERKPLDELDKEKWKKLLKEIVANTTKLIGELNAAMDKQIAIIDDKSKTFKEKGKALWELREENPKVYKVLGAVYEQFTPKLRHLCKIYKKLNDNEKEKVSEALREVRPNVTKLIGKLGAELDKGAAILFDDSKTPKEKLKALWERRKEHPKASNVLSVAVEQILPKRRPKTPLMRLLGKLNETEKVELEKAKADIRKEVREKATKLIGELNEMMEKQIVVVDDQSKSLAEKRKALWALRNENPKANNVLWAIFEQFAPKRRPFPKNGSMDEAEKAKWEEIKKEARANATKLIGELNEMLEKKTAILDDKSKKPREKLRALRELRKENPKAYKVLRTVFEQFIPMRKSWRRPRPIPRLPGRRLTETEKKARRERKRKEVLANVEKIISELNGALDKKIAIFDDKSKTFKEKLKAYAELRKQNPKVYRVLRFMFRQSGPKRPHFENESPSETRKADIENVKEGIKKEVRAKITKIIGELNGVLTKKTAILDDKSKTPKEKLEALWALRKENPEVYDVLWTIFEESVPRRHFIRFLRPRRTEIIESISRRPRLI